MEPTIREAAEALEWAEKCNPGPWADHSRYVARACMNIAGRCHGMSAELACAYGLLHDIGRHAGVTPERHLLDGYRYCSQRGWDRAARICISHAFMIQDTATSIGFFDMPPEDKAFMDRFVAEAVYDDYDLLVQLCDALALPTGFCLLEKRFVDVALRYGTPLQILPRWRRTLEIKALFDKKAGSCIDEFLPYVIENSLR